MKQSPLSPTPQLCRLAKRYVWWETPEWALDHHYILLANIMNLGCWNDIQMLRQEVTDGLLKKTLRHAPPGYFNYRSWDYWHAKFGISSVPPLPRRKLQ